MAKRGDYEYNHWKLAEAYKAFVKQWRRTPTARELAEDCELDEKTVRTHLKKMQSRILNGFRPLGEPAVFLVSECSSRRQMT